MQHVSWISTILLYFLEIVMKLFGGCVKILKRFFTVILHHDISMIFEKNTWILLTFLFVQYFISHSISFHSCILEIYISFGWFLPILRIHTIDSYIIAIRNRRYSIHQQIRAALLQYWGVWSEKWRIRRYRIKYCQLTTISLFLVSHLRNVWTW